MFITIVRTAILYFFVILGLRIMGKRQVGDMQPGELVITILISEIAAIPIDDINKPVITGILAIFTLVVVEILISFLTMKFINFRKLVNGDSAVIIKDGIIDQKLLRRLRITVPDIMEVLRGQDVFDLNRVSYAILETNGSLSVLLKSPYQTTEAKDLGCNADSSTLPVLVISDGVIIKDALSLAQTDRKQIYSKLQEQKLKIKDVFIMTIDKNGESCIVKKDGT
ncbi:MAG: DUF421 domain-containing protein [bacterium]|nr:DUF421 domain-containing protein [bacterium]